MTGAVIENRSDGTSLPTVPAGDDSSGTEAAPFVPEGIAVLGSHPATVGQAPFDKPWLIYTCSPHNFEKRQLPRWDAWFEVHIPVAHQTRAYSYLKFLETVPLVWMRDMDAIQHFPGAKPYPEDEMERMFCPFLLRTSSISLILAKAIVDCEKHGIKQIGLWGIMQASPNEYTQQRPGIQYFIWEAIRRGIKVLAPRASQLFELTPEDF